MNSFSELFVSFDAYIKKYTFPGQPEKLYAPAQYILSIGGKRIRPLLTLASYNLYKEDYDFAFEAAMSIEVFHNFSLLHDDIMDEAEMRRGRQAVHIKYDVNAAILTGDVMMIWSYKLLEKYMNKAQVIFPLFTKTAVEVCEGQRMDMDFETEDHVSIEDYIEMITLKTSVLLGAALKLGGQIANCSDQDAFHLYEFGKNLGIAFQIQDDLLDTFGDQETFGKKIGGDILQKKKTYLYLKSLTLLSSSESENLKALFAESYDIISEEEHISKVKDLYKIAHVDVHAEELKLVYQQLAYSHLNALSVGENRTGVLKSFSESLFNRKS